MALTVRVSKGEVTEIMESAWTVRLIVNLMEDTVGVDRFTVSEIFKTGDNISNLYNSLLTKAQARVDKYKGEADIYENPLYVNLASAVEDNLNLS